MLGREKGVVGTHRPLQVGGRGQLTSPLLEAQTQNPKQNRSSSCATRMHRVHEQRSVAMGQRWNALDPPAWALFTLGFHPKQKAGAAHGRSWSTGDMRQSGDLLSASGSYSAHLGAFNKSLSESLHWERRRLRQIGFVCCSAQTFLSIK